MSALSNIRHSLELDIASTKLVGFIKSHSSPLNVKDTRARGLLLRPCFRGRDFGFVKLQNLGGIGSECLFESGNFGKRKGGRE